MMNLHLADYVVFCTVLLFFLGIGISFSCTHKGAQDYLHGNHKMAAFPVVLSVAACFISVITIQGLPAEMYLYGVTSVFTLAAVWGSMVALFTFLPLLYPLKLTSVYQYLEGRFHHSAPKIVGATLGCMSMILLASVCIYNPAVAMESATRIPSWIIVIVIASISTCFTALGGFRAVVWSNALQVLIILMALVSICCLGIYKMTHSWSSDSWELLKTQQQLQINLSADPRVRNTVWMNALALGIYQLSAFTLQPQTLRYTAVTSLTKAKIVSGLGIAIAVVITVLSLLLGCLMLLRDVTKDCQQSLLTNVTSSYQLVYYHVYETLEYPGVSGAFIAAALCASLGSASLLHNGLVAILWNDLFERCCRSLSEKIKTILLKIIALFVGGLILLNSVVLYLTGHFTYQIACIVVTSCGGSVFGMFLVGAAFPFVGPWGATIGCVISTMVCIWISTGAAIYEVTWQAPSLSTNHTCATSNMSMTYPESLQIYSGLGLEQGPFYVSHNFKNRSDPNEHCTLYDVYSISPYMYHVIGCSITVILSLLISLIPALRQSDAHPKHLFPFVRWITHSYTIIEGDLEETTSKQKDTNNTQPETETITQPETETITPQETERITQSRPEAVQLNHTESDDESSTDDVFIMNENEAQRPSEEITVEVNNNIHAYRHKPNPDDPALILANILTNAQKTGERDRLISNTRL